MGFLANSRATNSHLHLRAADGFVPAPTGNLWVFGTCGHILDCVRPGSWSHQAWVESIEIGKPKKRRCSSCPKSDPTEGEPS